MKNFGNKRPTRVVIYPKDLMVFFDRKAAAARAMYAAMLKKLDKKPHQFITYHEFSILAGIDEEVILEYLRN